MVSSSQTGAGDGPSGESKQSGTRLEDRIFFKDKTNTLKGPFTERQVQEWYRQKLFDSSFIFYFTQDNKRPSDVERGGITLEELRSLNGIGCPFSRVDGIERGVREKRRERLEKIEKEIADLKEKCAAVPGMEKSLEQVERKLEGLTASLNKNTTKAAEKTPKVEPVQKKEQKYEEFGNEFAAYILDTLAVYGNGMFATLRVERRDKIESELNKGTSVEKVARKAACERILVEKMKEKEYFLCVFCNVIQFNYKQALVHFTRREHQEKMDPLMPCADWGGVRRLLNAVTDLPARLAAEDAKIEQERLEKYGSKLRSTVLPAGFRPELKFVEERMDMCFVPLDEAEGFGFMPASQLNEQALGAMRIVKGDIGRKAMAELHEHIGQAKTVCPVCWVKTGDREGFYAHHISTTHLEYVAKGPGVIFREAVTWLVNVHRKDLI